MTDHDPSYDVAVLGWWYGKNYGSILTYYGLHQAIKNLGHSVLMVHEPLGYNGYRVKWPDDILSLEFARRMGYEYTEQMDYHELPWLNTAARTFVVGSDQLWNPLIGRVNDDLFLDFVEPANDRVAYSTSFGNRGTEKFKPGFVAKHSVNLQRFKAISVREDYAVDTARDVFGAKAEVTADPVFLLPEEHYAKLADQATVQPEGDYLAVFYLDPTPEKKAVVLEVANKLGFERIVVIPNPDGGRGYAEELWRDEPRAEVIAEDAPENFLRTYRDAGYVVTDSFHGSAFAVIFGVPFSSIYNKVRGAGRFANLLEWLGFGETRRIYETDTAEDILANEHVSRDLDFTEARRVIEERRQSSTQWLRDALDPSTPGSASTDPNSLVTLTAPEFHSNHAGWRLDRDENVSSFRASPEAGVKGSHAWFDLPAPLGQDVGYTLTLDWEPRTDARTVNIHARNPKSGEFRVIGSVSVGDANGGRRQDSVSFVTPRGEFSQIMFGGMHFTGNDAGAVIHSVDLLKSPSAAGAAKKPGKPKSGFAAQARTLALKDYERQVRSFRHARSDDGLSGARARMIFHAHAIEKGLSRSNFRPGFGKIAVPGLAKEINAWLAAGRSTDDTFLISSAGVMRNYLQRHQDLGVDVSHFWSLFGEQAQHVINHAHLREGGVLRATDVRESDDVITQDRDFLDVMYGRRSVREYTDQPVSDAEIARAVEIAMQSPSVCNRQAARVHQFEDPALIKAVLDLQGGFSGYEMPPRLLLVSSDLDAFLFATERNQAFVDGGLFMMSLLLGLTEVGLGSCSLNTAMGTKKEAAIRQLIDIPDHEVFISFIAVGHYDGDVLVPRSKRVEPGMVLTKHGADSEQATAPSPSALIAGGVSA
ncbi:polysaccharide pyruvyl transferase family protein [Galactobacter sp.]|uniref:polysaccharide pyruvyl transferase family protein n=1 Tax=Galactobacter sp. TaxID=2676125 RepID=UPI0025B88D21|nr:polysaccharide pyruvyl transferase family protein [Galactobacter sp.]